MCIRDRIWIIQTVLSQSITDSIFSHNVFLHDFVLLSRPPFFILASGTLCVFLFLFYFLSVCCQLRPDTTWLHLWLFSGFLFPLCDCLLILTILRICSFEVFQKFLYISITNFLYNLRKIIFEMVKYFCNTNTEKISLYYEYLFSNGVRYPFDECGCI